MFGLRSVQRAIRMPKLISLRLSSQSANTVVPASDKGVVDNLVATKIDPKTLDTHGKFPGMPRHKNKLLDKIVLVWAGRYKTVGDVPNSVEYEEIHKAKTYTRVHVNIFFLFVGVIGCIGMVIIGKRLAKAGKSLEAENLAWHKQINEQYRREQEQANQK